MTRERADRDVAVSSRTYDRSRDATDVDEHRGRREPQLHERQQRVPARDQLGVVAVLGQQRDGLVGRAGAHVVELAGSSTSSSACDRFPDALGRRRHVDVGDAERRERVDDRVHHRRGRGDRARLADALDAHRVRRARRDRVVELEARELGRRRHEVVGERRGQEVAVGVVDGLLEERLRDALHDAAVHLALDDERVDLVAAVVDRDVAQELDRAGLLVDLDHA